MLGNALLLGDDGYQISRSVRLRSSASAYFNRTFGTPTIQNTWTISAWVKLGQIATAFPILQSYINASDRATLQVSSGSIIRLGATGVDWQVSNVLLRDPSAWYHLVVCRNGTASYSVFINNVSQTITYNSGTAAGSNPINQSSVAHWIGRGNTGGADFYSDGYLTEINFIDGQALTPSSFGETNYVTGVWQPKKYVGTYGTNGFYLNFADNSNNTATTIGKDSSGNGNNWTPNNISVTAGATYDSMLDVPTPWPDGGNGRGNYCTLNPLDNSQNAATGTLSNGNLTRTDSTATNTATFGTMFVSSGQWYYEVLVQAISSTTANCFAALSTNNKAVFVALRPDGSVLGCTKSGSGTYTTNDVLGIAVDIAGNTVYVYKNGALLYTLTPTTALTDFTPSIADGTSATGAVTASFNFGQQPFSYTPPSGYLALNTQNLPTPTILNGRQYFDAVRFTGNGGSQTLTQDGNGNALLVNGDFHWFKRRGAVQDHFLLDRVRGFGNYLSSNLTAAEASTTILTSSSAGSIVVNGFPADTYVDWVWQEGATQGFDIVTYTGNSTASRSISHSLGVTPAMIIVKNRSAVQNWPVAHTSLTVGNLLTLDTTQASTAAGTRLRLGNSSSFTVGDAADYGITNQTGQNYVAYCFAAIAGFSAFGSYTGNGSADGPFVFCGFRPRWIMIKETTAASTSDWVIHDTARASFNADDLRLLANSSGAELNTGFPIDELSNGFKIRNTGNGANRSNGTYIFAAFAENPFKHSLAR